jgi:hypothetical protein
MLSKTKWAALSARGTGNIAAIMPKVSAQIAERNKEDSYDIDMSTAENFLLRDELTAICKAAINENLISQVILPQTYAKLVHLWLIVCGISTFPIRGSSPGTRAS